MARAGKEVTWEALNDLEARENEEPEPIDMAVQNETTAFEGAEKVERQIKEKGVADLKHMPHTMFEQKKKEADDKAKAERKHAQATARMHNQGTTTVKGDKRKTTLVFDKLPVPQREGTKQAATNQQSQLSPKSQRKADLDDKARNGGRTKKGGKTSLAAKMKEWNGGRTAKKEKKKE
ncbi:hypothetical protein BDV95DRAFT_613243 [Massariosphaeria phaeospora]|uniref:Uncharacterized protein n=1 Tax=Massariosphaeria phaeospora TaxID=100035 RepID=A0A7C8MEA4_9PLEO|nr:hypothetical protein BDV95DRAFT_613243 [Massariosphaeria phaeospora]